jgi:hypothetical protein
MEQNLKSFAELVKQGQRDKQIKEAEEQEARLARTAPLLSELFSTISKAKELSTQQKAQEEPLLNELRAALGNPEEFKNSKKEKTEKILELVNELETKATLIQAKVDEPKESTSDLEKKFLTLFNRLQSDFQTLKKYVEVRPQNTGGYYGGAGSGEVRILRMDDVVKGQTPENGAVMTWDSTLNKFKCIVPTNTGTDEEMPYAKRIDFITDDLLYKGEAVVGSLENLPVWRIRKLAIGEDSDVTETWANGDSLYNKVWSDRLTLTYI